MSQKRKKEMKNQLDKFIETARSLGCDESEEAFDAKLKALATVKPMTQEQVKTSAKKKK